jgi:hypothetical protein
VQYLEIQEIISGHAILHILLTILIILREPSQLNMDQPMTCNHPPLLCNSMLWKSFESEKTQKNRQRGPCTYENITYHLLGMGLYSISANYSPDKSLSNGIIIFRVSLPIKIFWLQKLGENKKSYIIGDVGRERV